MNKIKKFFVSLFKGTDGQEPKLVTLYKKDSTQSVVASLLCILAGIAVGFVFMLIVALISPTVTIVDAFYGLGIIFAGPFASGAYASTSIGNMLFYATPLILTGLSVGVAFKTGLFNIGAAGQYYMGTLGALLVALNITASNGFTGFLVWLLAVLVAIVFGAIWGAIPGLFKALFNVNEVIVCIMTNWIAANIVSWVFSSMPSLHNLGMGKSSYLITTATTNTGTPNIGLDILFKGSYLDIGIFIAIGIAIFMGIVLNKTTFGYELQACGLNRNASRYAGMNDKRNIILSMAIAGGLAGIGGALYYLNPGIEFNYASAYLKLPDNGFNGIPVALLASNNPIGTIFAGIFLKYLNQGGENLVSAGYNRYVADIIIATIIYFSGFSKYIRDLLAKKKANKKQVAVTETSSNATEIPSDVVTPSDAIDASTEHKAEEE